MNPTVFSLQLSRETDPFETFRAVRALQPDAFFFETAEAIGELASLSVIGVGSFERLEGPVFAALRARETFAAPSEIPYARGGVFGCIGYDAIAELEPKLAAYGNLRAVDSDSSHVVFARHLIVFDTRAGLVHFIGAAARDFVPCLSARSSRSFVAEEMAESRLVSTLGKQKFFEGVQTLKEHIKDGNIFQAVLAERFECEVHADALNIFAALRVLSPTPYSYFFSFGAREFFGASPEALLKIAAGKMRTHPIAGTRPRGATLAQDRVMERRLSRSRKEAAEHLMLVDLARNDLGRVALAGSVEVNFFRSVQKFSNVMHLVSEVDAQLDPAHGTFAALGACFPAGTLSGAPKLRAMQLLSELEPVARGFYGGAVIGYDPETARLDSCIAIRSLEMRGGRALLRAGAGIVADSKPQAEYDEIAQKLKPLRQAIAAAERARS